MKFRDEPKDQTGESICGGCCRATEKFCPRPFEARPIWFKFLLNKDYKVNVRGRSPIDQPLAGALFQFF
jgi:hypothetical protein